jgi:hypothetical protein
MKTQAEIAELAKQYAYDTMTCPGSPDNIDEVVDMWWENKHHNDVIVWEPFEEYEPEELYSQFEDFQAAFQNCIKEFLEK